MVGELQVAQSFNIYAKNVGNSGQFPIGKEIERRKGTHTHED